MQININCCYTFYELGYCFSSVGKNVCRKGDMYKIVPKLWKKVRSTLHTIIEQGIDDHCTRHYLPRVMVTCVYVIQFFIDDVFHDSFDHFSAMHTISYIACVILCVLSYLPLRLKPQYFVTYWYIVICFCIPFLSMYAIIASNINQYWLMNGMVAVIILLMLVNWLSFAFILIVGYTLAIVFCLARGYIITDAFSSGDYTPISVFCKSLLLIFTFLLIKSKESDQNKKYKAMQIFGGAIAHEVNAPLAAMRMMSITFKDISESITKHSQKLQTTKGKGIVYQVHCEERDYKMLSDVLPKNFLRSSQEAIKIVEILLSMLKDSAWSAESSYSIVKTINEVIDDKCDDIWNEDGMQNKRDRIKVVLDRDFKFYGSKRLMKHVFQNLIRNSFKHGGKDVIINIRIDRRMRVHFLDNGNGIEAEDQKKLFKPFYTQQKTGTGIGLAFCNLVMRSIGGGITCKSEVGKYTEFILQFPLSITSD